MPLPLVAAVVKGILAGGGGLIVVVRGVPVVEYVGAALLEPVLRIYIGKAVTLCGTEWHLPKLNTPAILTIHSADYSIQITDTSTERCKLLLPLPLRLITRALLLIDEAGVVPPMPPDAFVKVEVVVKEEEEGLDLDDWFCAGSHGRGRALLRRDCAGRHRWERALGARPVLNPSGYAI